MTINFIKDIENVFLQAENAIKSKLTGATADVAKKTVAVAQVAEHLAASFISDAETTWSSLDNSNATTIVATVLENVQSGNYEKAAFGLFYLIYQSAVEVTGKVETLTEKAIDHVPGGSSVVSEVKSVVDKVENEARVIYNDVRNWIAPQTPVQNVTITPAPVASPATTTPAEPVAVAAPATTPVATEPQAVAQTNPTPVAQPAPAAVAVTPKLAS